MNCSRDDLILLPIPFMDLSSRKVRPAMVIGFGSLPSDLFVVPLTSQFAIADFDLGSVQLDYATRLFGKGTCDLAGACDIIWV